MSRKKLIIQIDKDKCSGCGKCKQCPKITRPLLCSGCGKCVTACPNNAITLVERTNKTHNTMKKRGIRHVIIVLLAITGFSVIIMLLWNALLPDIFGIANINFWQAGGLLILSRILFGNMGKDALMRAHLRHHSHIHKKWMNMTPEQRLKFINKRKQFGFGNAFCEERFDRNKHGDAKEEND